MTATITPDRITVTNAEDDLVFDTDDQLFHVTDFIEGTISIPEKDQSTLQTSETVLDSCHEDATVAVGVANIEFTDGSFDAGIPGYGWFNVSGTYIHWIDGYAGVNFNVHSNPVRVHALTFFCEGGDLKLREQIQMYNVSISGTDFTLKEFDLHYRIWCGLFDQ